jgi:hypothetical protein
MFQFMYIVCVVKENFCQGVGTFTKNVLIEEL